MSRCQMLKHFVIPLFRQALLSMCIATFPMLCSALTMVAIAARTFLISFDTVLSALHPRTGIA
jgi:hypothetical protein